MFHSLSRLIGTQNCMDGTDEENCDEVEMNECEQNEFRCLNGLCIPEEYWVDGKLRIFMKSTYQTVTIITIVFYNTFSPSILFSTHLT